MIKRALFILWLLGSVFIMQDVQANELTHTIGTTGYMIQEAMWAKAAYHDKQNYNEAVKLQYQAKDYMRGTHKDGRNVQKALEFTLKAYDLAKTARDKALQDSGLVVSR